MSDKYVYCLCDYWEHDEFNFFGKWEWGHIKWFGTNLLYPMDYHNTQVYNAMVREERQLRSVDLNNPHLEKMWNDCLQKLKNGFSTPEEVESYFKSTK